MKKFDAALKEISINARRERIASLIEQRTADSPAELLEKSLKDWVDAFVKILPDYVLKEMLEGKDNNEAIAYIERLMSLLAVPADQAEKYMEKIKEALQSQQPEE